MLSGKAVADPVQPSRLGVPERQLPRVKEEVVHG
jgi:hypothetical protein